MAAGRSRRERVRHCAHPAARRLSSCGRSRTRSCERSAVLGPASLDGMRAAGRALSGRCRGPLGWEDPAVGDGGRPDRPSLHARAGCVPAGPLTPYRSPQSRYVVRAVSVAGPYPAAMVPTSAGLGPGSRRSTPPRCSSSCAPVPIPRSPPEPATAAELAARLNSAESCTGPPRRSASPAAGCRGPSDGWHVLEAELATLLDASGGPAAEELEQAVEEMRRLAQLWPVEGRLPGSPARGRSFCPIRSGSAGRPGSCSRGSRWPSCSGSDRRSASAASPARRRRSRRSTPPWPTRPPSRPGWPGCRPPRRRGPAHRLAGPRAPGWAFRAIYCLDPRATGVQLALQGWVVPSEWGDLRRDAPRGRACCPRPDVPPSVRPVATGAGDGRRRGGARGRGRSAGRGSASRRGPPLMAMRVEQPGGHRAGRRWSACMPSRQLRRLVGSPVSAWWCWSRRQRSWSSSRPTRPSGDERRGMGSTPRRPRRWAGCSPRGGGCPWSLRGRRIPGRPRAALAVGRAGSAVRAARPAPRARRAPRRGRGLGGDVRRRQPGDASGAPDGSSPTAAAGRVCCCARPWPRRPCSAWVADGALSSLGVAARGHREG